MQMIDFREIMVVSGDPEHRNHRAPNAFLCHLSQRYSGKSLVDCIQWAREKTGLLPGRDAECLAGE